MQTLPKQNISKSLGIPRALDRLAAIPRASLTVRDNMRYFVSNSDVGRRILKTCPIGTDCHVVGTVENDQDAGDWSPIITEVSEVGRNNDAKQAKVRHDRPCDGAQDHPEKFNFTHGDGNAIMFGGCGEIEDLPVGAGTSRHHWWSAFNCGYFAYRENKKRDANPYSNEEVKVDGHRLPCGRDS
jgi:hypothetical protein